MSGKTRLLDSITDVTKADAGMVAISGSHGGLYPAAIASRAELRAVIFNDAGIGLEQAGIGGVIALGRVGMAAAAMDCMSARIGSARDGLAHGRISFVNAVAQNVGVEVGMAVTKAGELLQNAPTPRAILPEHPEARGERLLANGVLVHLLDSASMVGPEHIGQVVITGSHGALIGGDPARALKAAARIGVFNDAGMGPGEIGASRLPALAAQGIAAVTVAARSARIGDAASALESGVISRANAPARALGALEGRKLHDWVAELTPH